MLEMRIGRFETVFLINHFFCFLFIIYKFLDVEFLGEIPCRHLWCFRVTVVEVIGTDEFLTSYIFANTKVLN